VRNLQKQIEKLLRKVAFQIATKEVTKVTVSENNLEKFVGAPIFPKDRIYDSTPVGVVMGLAWTSLGGATLFIECVDVTQSDKGALRCTGQMGDVMKESTDVAFTVARKWLRKVEPDNKFFDQHVLHMHIPEGATPKDGPSAGITMATTLLSLAMHKPVRQKLAMTGEMTLTEKVLPVGGIKEKVLASQRAGVSDVILPVDNRRDWEELDEKTRESTNVHFASTYEDVFKIAFAKAAPSRASKVKATVAADAPAANADLNKGHGAVAKHGVGGGTR